MARFSDPDAPLRRSVDRYLARGVVAFHTPAHAGRIPLGASDRALSAEHYASDLPLVPDVDDLDVPVGALREAEERLATLYGSRCSHLLCGGSTLGVQVSMLAALRSGDSVLLSRDCHRSALAGVCLSGAVPHYVPVSWRSPWGPDAPQVETVRELVGEHRPRAVVLTCPTYYGRVFDVAPYAEICRDAGAALIVDAAHGAHLTLLDTECCPVARGADLVVTSIHKTLGGLVGSAAIHVGPDAIVSDHAVRTALKLLRSTSQSLPVLASIDLAQHWARTEGREAFAAVVRQHERLAREIAARPTLDAAYGAKRDPTKLIVRSSRVTGHALEDMLYEQHGILCEFSDSEVCVFVLGPWHVPSEFLRLGRSLAAIDEQTVGLPVRPQYDPDAGQPIPAHIDVACAPSAVRGHATERVLLEHALGRIASCTVSSYPPGIPIVAPGERIHPEVLEALSLARDRGYHLSEDLSDGCIPVVDSNGASHATS